LRYDVSDKKKVLVEWKDAACTATWQAEGTALTVESCWSMGWLLQDTEDSILLAGTVSSNGDFNQSIVIPRGMVVDIREIYSAPDTMPDNVIPLEPK